MNNELRVMKIKFIFIVLIILIIGIIGWLIFSGNYPVVIIDWKIITAKDFNEDFTASLNYYEQMQKVYPHTKQSYSVGVYGGDSQLLRSEEVKNEIKRALLT